MTFLNPGVRRHRATDSIRRNIAGFDKLLTFAVSSLLILGTLLVYAATKQWFQSQGLDPQYYLKRHAINIAIGVLLAYLAT